MKWASDCRVSVSCSFHEDARVTAGYLTASEVDAPYHLNRMTLFINGELSFHGAVIDGAISDEAVAFGSIKETVLLQAANQLANLEKSALPHLPNNCFVQAGDFYFVYHADYTKMHRSWNWHDLATWFDSGPSPHSPDCRNAFVKKLQAGELRDEPQPFDPMWLRKQGGCAGGLNEVAGYPGMVEGYYRWMSWQGCAVGPANEDGDKATELSYHRWLQARDLSKRQSSHLGAKERPQQAEKQRGKRKAAASQ